MTTKKKETISLKGKGTNIRCKRNMDGNFIQIPSDIYNYVRLQVIKPVDVSMYLLLLKYDNDTQGYAYPSEETLSMDFGGASNNTIRDSLARLDNAGLIVIEKSPVYKNKNVYFVELPHSEEKLAKLLPAQYEVYRERKEKTSVKAEKDKERLQNYREKRKAVQEVQTAQEQPTQPEQTTVSVMPEDWDNDEFPYDSSVSLETNVRVRQYGRDLRKQLERY